jgi:hypothetical protein
MKRISPRKRKIKEALAMIRQIKKHNYGDKCFFCGRPGSDFKYPLSNCHILPVGSHPRLELCFENIVLACWSKEYYYKTCHNLWERREQPYRNVMERQLMRAKGKDYKQNLLLQEKIMQPLNKFRVEMYHKMYEMELEETKC